MEVSPPIDMVFIHGRPGSGKGTQVDELKIRHPELTVIYPGKILRGSQDPEDDLYTRFNSFVQPHVETMANGGLIPPDDFFKIITPLIEETIQAEGSQLLFDGFPRGVEYLRKFDQMIQSLREKGNDVRMLHVYLAASEMKAGSRIGIRKEGYDQRIDDKSEAVKRRMEVFKSETFPMLRELNNRGELVIIRGDRNVTEVQQELEQRVSQFLKPRV